MDSRVMRDVSRSVWSKWRPNRRDCSVGLVASIFMATLWPARATSTDCEWEVRKRVRRSEMGGVRRCEGPGTLLPSTNHSTLLHIPSHTHRPHTPHTLWLSSSEAMRPRSMPSLLGMQSGVPTWGGGTGKQACSSGLKAVFSAWEAKPLGRRGLRA